MRAIHMSWAAWATALALAGCGSEARLKVEDGTGPDPQLPPPADEGYFPVVNIAPAVGWAEGETPVRCVRDAGVRLCRQARSSTMDLRAPGRRRAGRRDQRARAAVARRAARHQGLGDGQGDEARGRRRAERESHHAPQRFRRDGERGTPFRPVDGTQFAVRDGARRRPALRREHRRPRPLSLPLGSHHDRGGRNASRGPAWSAS